MKYPIFTLLVLVHSSVISAEVKWDCFQLHEIASSWSGRVVGCYYYDQDALGNILSTPEVGLRYYLDAMGERLVKVDGGGDHNAGDNFNIWILADKDDVLSDGYFEQPHIVLKSDYARITPSSTGNSIDIVSGRRYYLALIGSYWGYDAVDEYYNYYGWSERDYYGWVELEASKAGLDIVSSAFSYSPLIVGGGLAPIPEPSAGVLLLLGLSALALRRRE